MSFMGTLDTVALADVLQILASQGKSGILHVERGRSQTRLYFEDGFVVACWSDDPSLKLGQFLVYTGALTQAQLREVMAEQANTGIRMDDIITQQGFATRDAIEAAVAEKAHETVMSLFDTDTGGFRFEPDAGVDPKAMAYHGNAEEIVAQGTRWRNDREMVRTVLIDADPTPVPSPEAPDPSEIADFPTRAVLESVDGRRSFDDIRVRVHGSPTRVGQILLALIGEGMVQLAETFEPVGAPSPVAEPASAAPAAPTEVAPSPAPPAPAAVTPVAVVEAPVVEAPVVEAPVVEAPVVEAPVVEAPVVEAPVADVPVPAEAPPRPLALDELPAIDAEIEAGNFSTAFARLDEANRAEPQNSMVRTVLERTEGLFREHLATLGVTDQAPLSLTMALDEVDLDSLQATELAIVEMADGTWNLESLQWVLPARPIEVLTAMKSLLDRGLITPSA